MLVSLLFRFVWWAINQSDLNQSVRQRGACCEVTEISMSASRRDRCRLLLFLLYTIRRSTRCVRI